MNKYIKLFEQWQWLNREDGEDSDERDFRTTVDSLLTWAAGPGWREDWSWMQDLLQVDDEWLEEDELVGYHELLKKSSSAEIEVYSQEVDGQIDSSWSVDGVDFNLISWDWPFSEGEEDLTSIESEAVARIERELKGDPIGREANVVDIIDWVQAEIRDRETGADELTGTGFKNWFLLRRTGSN